MVKHALVIGGSGMLAGTVLWLADEGARVSVVARNEEKMQRMLARSVNTERIMPVYADYTNDPELEAALTEQIRKYGPPGLVVAWVHSNAPEALPSVIRLINKTGNPWKLFHVLGSSTDLASIQEGLTVPETCDYHQVQLGFVQEDGISRWLTNEEISDGVIEAIRADERVKTVGTLEPWDERP
ncbi:short-chain dehydrogenase [Indiicoccus explosivorum]|uniref:short-chain dehydrogenase n=1 Tax=Indiicoccus explosivorum TaxID=1917864 RepID=UPI001F4EF4A6|nr:short-chain dehydrogenase [Indiicoccus explosivorum]